MTQVLQLPCADAWWRCWCVVRKLLIGCHGPFFSSLSARPLVSIMVQHGFAFYSQLQQHHPTGACVSGCQTGCCYIIEEQLCAGLYWVSPDCIVCFTLQGFNASFTVCAIMKTKDARLSATPSLVLCCSSSQAVHLIKLIGDAAISFTSLSAGKLSDISRVT